MSNGTREPFEWVEIDQDLCSRTYSISPCTASLSIGKTECYNTRITCQDAANYDLGSPLTLRFCMNGAFLPNDGNYYMPTLVSASLSAGSINPVGANANSSALGTRGGISVRFQDGPHTDRYVDPYIANRVSRDAGYIATERGTFWSKWRARNPYYVGRVLRHKTGFIVDGAVTDVVTRTYFITGFDGPDGNGSVSITAKDILSQFANEKAKAPAASNGRLLAALTNVAATLTLDPVGISSEYPASGVIRIGSEIMTYTKGSGDVLNITRAQYGSTAGTGNAGDVVQLCTAYTSQSPATILEDLLTTYAGIPSGYLDTAQWAQEQTDYMPRLYSAVITEPTGVQELVAEMCEQMYFYVIWDEREAKLKMRAIRPAQDDTIYDLSDFTNFVSESVSLRDLPEQLVTQVWVYYGLINYAGSTKEEKNYAVREILLTDESLPEKQGTEKIKKIYCRWIPSTNGAAAVDLGEKMLARYGTAPRQVSFTLTGKDSAVWIGDFCTVTHRLSVDATGAQLPLNIQVLSAQESRAGVEFRYSGQEFVYEAPVDPNDRLIVFAANQTNINLRTIHDSIYAAPVGGETIRVVVRSGVVIGGTQTNVAAPLYPMMNRDFSSNTFYSMGDPLTINALSAIAYQDMWIVPCTTGFDVGSWPANVNIIITIEAGAYIVGQGGFGGNYSVWDSGLSNIYGVGSDGGHALTTTYPITINNQGTIAGGGAGGPMFPFVAGTSKVYGGGGAGYREGLAAPSVAGDSTILRQTGSGSLTNGNTGGKVRYVSPQGIVNTFEGGVGGALGQPLFVGPIWVNGSSPAVFRPWVGSRAGNAIISGANLITWTNKGDVRGAEA